MLPAGPLLAPCSDMPVETTDPLTLAAFILEETEWCVDDEADLPTPPPHPDASAEGAEGGAPWTAR